MSRLIAAEIRKQLFLRDMTGTQLGERAGMTQPYISRRLTGATAFDVDDLQKIAEVLGLEVADLLPPAGVRSSQQPKAGSVPGRPNVHPVSATSRSLPRQRSTVSDSERRGRRLIRHATDGAR